MSGLFRRTARGLIRAAGYDRFEKPFIRYFVIYALFTMASVLSSSFFSIFLLRATGSAAALMKYNLLLALVQPLVMMLAVKVMRLLSTTRCTQIGMLFHAIAYLILAVAGEPQEAVVYAVSIIFAAGNAFYFTAYTPQILHYTKEHNRETAFGAMSLLSTAVGLVLPVLTGFFISSFGDLTGYRVLFALSAAGVAAGVALAFRMEPVSQTSKEVRGHMRAAAKGFFRSRAMMSCMAATALDALRVSGVTYFASLLVYELLQKESVIGVVNTAVAILTMLSSLAYGRLVTAKNRGRMMLTGAVVQLLAALIVCLWRTAPGYVIYALLGGVAASFLSNPVVTGYLGVVERDPVLRERGGEVHTLREIFYAAGRALGLVPVFFLQDPAQMAAIMMVVMTLVQIPAALLTGRLQKYAGDTPD